MTTRVLLVDDDEGFRVAVGEYLVQKGHEVRLADSGADALDKLAAQFKPTHIITDFNMPGMNGIELSMAIREKETMPIYICTMDDRAMPLAEAMKQVFVIDKNPAAILSALTYNQSGRPWNLN